MVPPEENREKRTVERKYLVFYLRVFDGLSSRVLGHLIDFSEKGLMMVSDDPIEINEEYRLRMCLPSQFKDKTEVVFTATSRWCKQDSNPDFYLSGFQMHQLDEETEKPILRLIRDFSC